MNRIYSLQVFRGLAALAVVTTHTTIATGAFIADVPVWLDSILKRGYLGVDFFFVLSGFIIMYSHINDKKSLGSTKDYIIKRLVRIFPAYLPICFGMLFLYRLMPELSASGGREYSIISSIFLLPSSLPPVLSVAWTLVHELFFYFIFLSFFISRKLFFSVIFFWFLSILFWPGAGVGGYILSPLNIEFMFGVFMALVFVKVSIFNCKEKRLLLIKLSLLLILIGLIIIFFSIYVDSVVDYLERVLFSLGLSFVVLGVVYIDQHFLKYIWPNFLVVLGNASFSIYLIHNPLLSVTQRLLGKVPFIDWQLGLFFGMAFSISTGLIYFKLVEKPITTQTRRLFNKV